MKNKNKVDFQMDFKGNINNQGNKEDRIILSEEGDYCYPCSKATYSILEFGSVAPNLKQGMIISTITDETIEYDTGINRYIGCGLPKGKFQYPYNYRVRVHPIGYNYDGYHEEIKELNGIDFYAIDEILEKEENPNSTM